jgi:Lar family restriction alleviation protein
MVCSVVRTPAMTLKQERLAGTESLKACPFCGGAVVVVAMIRDGRRETCMSCGSSGKPTSHGLNGYEATEAEAITAWNHRADRTEPASSDEHCEKCDDSGWEVRGPHQSPCDCICGQDVLRERAERAAAREPASASSELETRLRAIIEAASEPAPAPLPEQDSRVGEAMAGQADMQARRLWGGHKERACQELIEQAPAVLDTLATLRNDLSRKDDEIANVVNDIAVMMSEFVDNWPAHKKLETSLALIAKTMRASRDEAAALRQALGEVGNPAKLAAAIKATEYKYFGDYEFSDDQHDAVDTLVEFARAFLTTNQDTPDAG